MIGGGVHRPVRLVSSRFHSPGRCAHNTTLLIERPYRVHACTARNKGQIISEYPYHAQPGCTTLLGKNNDSNNNDDDENNNEIVVIIIIKKPFEQQQRKCLRFSRTVGCWLGDNGFVAAFPGAAASSSPPASAAEAADGRSVRGREKGAEGILIIIIMNGLLVVVRLCYAQHTVGPFASRWLYYVLLVPTSTVSWRWSN